MTRDSCRGCLTDSAGVISAIHHGEARISLATTMTKKQSFGNDGANDKSFAFRLLTFGFLDFYYEPGLGFSLYVSVYVSSPTLAVTVKV
jgi:hypothetical protein